MRNFIVSLVSLLVILSLWGGFSFYSKNMSSSLQNQTQHLISSSINKEEWDSADIDYRKLQNMWTRYKKTASLFLDSKDINEIDGTMGKAYLYMQAEDVSNSSGEFSYLKDRFKTLHQNESITFYNIF